MIIPAAIILLLGAAAVISRRETQPEIPLARGRWFSAPTQQRKFNSQFAAYDDPFAPIFFSPRQRAPGVPGIGSAILATAGGSMMDDFAPAAPVSQLVLQRRRVGAPMQETQYSDGGDVWAGGFDAEGNAMAGLRGEPGPVSPNFGSWLSSVMTAMSFTTGIGVVRGIASITTQAVTGLTPMGHARALAREAGVELGLVSPPTVAPPAVEYDPTYFGEEGPPATTTPDDAGGSTTVSGAGPGAPSMDPSTGEVGGGVAGDAGVGGGTSSEGDGGGGGNSSPGTE